LGLDDCDLGDEGISLLVDAILEASGSAIKVLGLGSNEITSNGLAHLTRLLQHSSSVTGIHLDENPGLFNDQENSRLFASALRDTTLKWLRLNSCRIPSHVIVSLVQALIHNQIFEELSVYCSEQLQGDDLQRLLEIVPKMPSNLRRLAIHLDFSNKSVVSSFHWNTGLLSLNNGSEFVPGPISDILKRNRQLRNANELLDSEPHRQRTIPLGLWVKGIESLTLDNAGTTALYKILREKLVTWRAPLPQEAAASTTSAAALASAPGAASTATASFKDKKDKRSYAQASMGDDDEGEMNTKPSSLLLLEPQHHKRQRCNSWPPC
jgi:hypothetical protein